MQVVWLKRDLRLDDHEVFAKAQLAAPREGPVLPLYVHEPSLIAQPDFAAQHKGFIRETLDELYRQLAALGGTLVEQVGEAVDVLEAIWSQTKFKTLWAHQETGNLNSYARDLAVHAWCRERGVTFVEIAQNGVNRGTRYKQVGFKFGAHLTGACTTAPFRLDMPLAFAVPPLPSVAPLKVPAGQGVDKVQRAKGGRTRAMAALSLFAQEGALLRYPGAISSPNTAVQGCSRLSPYLAFGVLSDREALQAVNRAIQAACVDQPERKVQALQESGRFYAERFYWRSAYLQSMELRPGSERDNDLPAFNHIRENVFAEDWLLAWQEGRTGYPMVDAGMKMLAATGWANMRLRGMLASFAVNELWLPWRAAGLHLAREFLDYEPGIHWNQLQIHAGSSRLSGPLTYNPVKQAQDHDPSGTFVKQWLPELRSVPAAHLAEPWKMPASVQSKAGCQIGRDYPAPIVQHSVANEAARHRVAALRDNLPVPELVYWKNRARDLALAKQESLF